MTIIHIKKGIDPRVSICGETTMRQVFGLTENGMRVYLRADDLPFTAGEITHLKSVSRGDEYEITSEQEAAMMARMDEMTQAAEPKSKDPKTLRGLAK